MGRKHVAAALDRCDEASRNLIVVHARGQGINRRLPLRMMNFSGDALIGNDPCVVLSERYKDEHAGSVLLECGTMCACTLFLLSTAHYARRLPINVL